MTGDGAAGGLQLADLLNQRGVELQLAVQHQVGGHFLGDAGGFLHLGDLVVLGRALGGEAQHGHAGLDARQGARGIGGAQGDVGQGLGVGIDVHGAVGEDHDAVVAVLLVRALHQEAGGHGLDAGLGLDDLQRGAQHVAGGVDRAGDQAVGLTGLDHHDAVVHGILHGCGGLFLGHALGLAQLVQGGGVLGALLAGGGVDDLDALEGSARGDLLDLLGVAQQRQLRQTLLHDDGSGLHGAGLVALGQHDVHHIGLRLRLDLIDDCHCFSLRLILRAAARGSLM